MKSYLLAFLSGFALSVIAGIIVIPLLKKVKAGQPIYEYVKTHSEKNGTPTMGGLFFIISAVVIFYLFGGSGRISNISVVIGLAYMLVGLIDDFCKIKNKRNQGLKPYQKIIFQFSIAIISGVFCYVNGITVFHLPFTKRTIDLNYFSIPFIALIFIAITNCVNLTDGVDGLASSVSSVYLVFLIILIALQTNVLGYMYLLSEEYKKLILLSICLLSSILGFMVFNVNKASVFMGDTGSLSLGGFLGCISIFSSNSLFIPLLGITFVVSGISVIMQVLYYKKTKKRIFLMAPYHHHLQLKGLTENKICYIYSILTIVFGAISIIGYL